MCGITGFTWEDRALLKEMTDIIRYRGPDDHGYYTDSFVSLGHRRLSIIDLSKAGHQPMSDSEGIYIVFNGEIYNYKDLKNELQHKYHFKSDTDTEVLIHGYKEWGPEALLKKLNGMFAFAIWDENKKLLFLARDRLGIKPLYYTQLNKGFAFASEMKSLLLIPDIKKELDINALNSYFTYRFIPSEKTVLTQIKKLLPGHYLLLNLKKSKANPKPEPVIRKYWELVFDESSSAGKSEDFFIKKFQSLLTNCVNKHLMSDVPLGTFLSGGLDSSLITAINAKLKPDRIKTFTVGFGHETDEFKYARKVAEHLNTDHHELLLEYGKITNEIPKIVWYMDEPNSDITMFPLYFLSRFSRKHVTVVNTGEGADELFSGYPHFNVGSNSLRFVPESIRRTVYSLYYSPFKSRDRKKLFSPALTKMPEEDNSLKNYLSSTEPKSLLNRILLFDIKNELPNWQLARVDRMTMAHAQEARVPFLDYRMVEFSANLPTNLKLRSLNSKYLIKKAACSYLPHDIITRKKQGFTTPRDEWFKNDFMDIAFNILSEKAVKSRGLFSYSYIQKLKENVKNKGDKPFRPYTYRLLVLALFELWAQTYLDNNSKVLKLNDLL